jgi:magnesium transporter
LIKVYKSTKGSTTLVDAVDPAWLLPESNVWVWADLDNPGPEEARLLREVFHFHELAVEDALAALHHPKIESYGSYLYLILHGIDFRAKEHEFRTQDIDFFLGDRFLVTVHPGVSRSIGKVGDVCTRNPLVLGEGPAALLHRIIDAMVDNYRPEVDALQDRLDQVEKEVFERPDPELARRIIDLKRDVSSLRRVVQPQRDVVGRLARREFPIITEALSYRFRDVYDHLVRLTDESMFYGDRITSLLDAHLSTVSNQLNGVMKVLTVITTLFMPLTFITGLYGMNVELPHFGLGDHAFFWALLLVMSANSMGMLVFFRLRKWI